MAIPRDYDQFDYAARIVHHKLGLRGATIEGSAELLERLLDRQRWPALARFQQYARAYSPVARFLEVVDRLIERG